MPAKIRICTNRPVYSDRRDGYTDCKPSAIGMRKCRFLRYLVWMFRLSAMAAIYNLNNPHRSFYHKGNDVGTMLCSHRRTYKQSLVMVRSHKYFRFRFPIFRKTDFYIFACKQNQRTAYFCGAAIWQMFQIFMLFKWLR